MTFFFCEKTLFFKKLDWICCQLPWCYLNAKTLACVAWVITCHQVTSCYLQRATSVQKTPSYSHYHIFHLPTVFISPFIHHSSFLCYISSCETLLSLLSSVCTIVFVSSLACNVTLVYDCALKLAEKYLLAHLLRIELLPSFIIVICFYSWNPWCSFCLCRYLGTYILLCLFPLNELRFLYFCCISVFLFNFIIDANFAFLSHFICMELVV